MELIEIKASLISEIRPERVSCGHKGTFGTSMLVAGSKFMTGALVLATDSCLRSGVGMVRAFSEGEALDAVRVNSPCALTSAYEDSDSRTYKAALSYLEKTASAGIGPGLNEENKVNMGLLEILIKNSKALSIDAGALNIISKNKEIFLPLLKERFDSKLSPAVLTPHIGEFGRLTGKDVKSMTKDELKASALEFASSNGVILILKSSTIYIATPEGTLYVYEGNNSGMAKGGSGDVLMGLLTGLLAQMNNPVDAAVSAVYFHQEAGRIASKEIGKRAMLPSDLTKYFGPAFMQCGW